MYLSNPVIILVTYQIKVIKGTLSTPTNNLVRVSAGSNAIYLWGLFYVISSGSFIHLLPLPCGNPFCCCPVGGSEDVCEKGRSILRVNLW